MDVAVNFTVTHPLGLSQHPLIVKNVARHCQRAEAAKTAAEGDLCQRAGWGFAPAAFTPWGGSGPTPPCTSARGGPPGHAHLRGWPKQRRLREIHEGLSLTLAREVVRQLSLMNRVHDACIGDV